MDRQLLDLFSITNEKATRNGDFLPEYVFGKIKKSGTRRKKSIPTSPNAYIWKPFFTLCGNRKLQFHFRRTLCRKRKWQN